MTVEDRELKEHFKFDEADLIANRNGQFSEKQRARLVEEDRKIQRRWGLRSIPFFLIAAVGPVAAVSAGDFFGLSWKIIWGFVWTGIWGGIGLIMLLSWLSKPKNLILAKTKGEINFVRDRSYSASRRTHSSALRLHVGRRSFDIEEDLPGIMQQGDEYMIYYEKDWETIVSVELVPQAEK